MAPHRWLERLRGRTAAPRRRVRAIAEEIEPRVLHAADHPGAVLAAATAAPPAAVAPPPEVRAVQDAPAQADAASREQWVFVDPGVADTAGLVDAIAARHPDDALRVVVLEAGRDGLEQIGEALQGRRDVAAMHLVGHGEPGAFELAGRRLDAAAIDAAADGIAGWRDALADDADLLLYGCDVAATPTGEALLERLARLTGADVAASVDPTGTAALGGDWDLEARVGAVGAASLFAAGDPVGWSGRLDPTLPAGATLGETILDPLHSPTLPTIQEGEASAGVQVSALLPAGSVTLDGMPLAEAGIAITALDTSLGAWQLSLDDGASWLTIDAAAIDASTNELALLLGPTARLRLLPSGDLNGTLAEAVTFRAWDRSAGTEGQYLSITATGGGSAFSTASDTASITVTAVDDAPSFLRGDGIVSTPVGTGDAEGRAAALQPDGKVVVAGFATEGTGTVLALVRYHSDGSLDDTFGAAGRVTTAIANGSASVAAVVVQPDGRIVVAGRVMNGSADDIVLARYHADGSPDAGFGTAGIVVTSIGGHEDAGTSVAIQTDGRIVVAGYSHDGADRNVALVRYEADGSLDTSFGTGGRVVTPVGSGTDQADSVTIQPDGKILVAGHASMPAFRFALLRYNADGSPDTGFGVGGRVITALGNDQGYAHSVVVRPDGRIVVGGSAVIGDGDFALAQYNADGSPDTTFGTGGTVTTDIGTRGDWLPSIALQPDGRVVAAGMARMGSFDDFAVVRYDPDGSLDASFGTGGKVTTDIGGSWDQAFGVMVRPDGRLAVAGWSHDGGRRHLALVCYDADGSPDATFDAAPTLGGSITYTLGEAPVALDTSVAVHDPELAALAGGAGDYGGAQLTLARDGAPDSTDAFSALGDLSFAAGDLVLSGAVIGSVTQAGGTLSLTFAPGTTQAQVDEALSSLAYRNLGTTPSSGVTLAWTFHDGDETGTARATGTTSLTLLPSQEGGGVDPPPAGPLQVDGPSSYPVPENTIPVATLSASPSGPVHVWTIAGGADAARFVLDGMTGALSFAAAPDHEAPADADTDNVYEVTVSVSDGTRSVSRALTVTVTPVDELAPAITSDGGGASASLSVPENVPAVTIVAATDPDTPAASLRFAIAGGADAARFTLDAVSGALAFATPPDHEAPADADADNVYDLVVAVTDGVRTDAQAIAVAVTPVDDEAPTIVGPAAVALGENATVVTRFTATDPDTPAPSLRFAIAGGEDAARFAIDPLTGVLSFSTPPDHEAPADANADNAYHVLVSVTDGVSIATHASVVSVNPVDDEAPAITSDGGGASASLSVPENVSIVTIVAATDPDTPAASLRFAIAGGADAARFTLDAVSGALAFATPPDHEAPADADADNVYDLVVAVTDGVRTDTQAIAVTVAPVDELAPAITSDGGGATASLSVPENVTAVTTVAATDPDTPAASLRFAIAGGADAARFTLDSVTGALSFSTPPDREAPADADGDHVYEVIVAATDGMRTDTQAIAVTVTPVDEHLPVLSVGPGWSLPEDSDAGLPGVSIADPDTDGDATVATVRLSVTHGTLRLDAVGDVRLVAGAAGTASLTVQGSVAQLRASLGTLRYRPDADFAGTDRLDLALEGAPGGGPGPGAPIEVAPLDDPAALRLPGPLATAEDVALRFATADGTRIAILDADGGPLALGLAVDAGRLELAGIAGLEIEGAPDGSGSAMTLRGEASAIQAALDGMRYLPSPDFNGTASLALLLRSADGTLVDARLAIDVRPADDPVGIRAPDGAALRPDGTFAFPAAGARGIEILDPDGDDPAVRVVLRVEQGTLRLGRDEGVSVVVQQGADGGSVLLLQGTASAAQAALATLGYAPPTGFSGPVRILLEAAQAGDPPGTPPATAALSFTLRAAVGPAMPGQWPASSGPDAGRAIAPPTGASALAAAVRAQTAASEPDETAARRVAAPARPTWTRAPEAPGDRDAEAPAPASTDPAPRTARSAWTYDAEARRVHAVRAAADAAAVPLVDAPRTAAPTRIAADGEAPRAARGRLALTAEVDATGPSTREESAVEDAERLGVGVALTATAVSAGLVGWTIYGATALWVLLATGRLARAFDPLPVLAREGRRADAADGEDDDEDDEPLRPAPGTRSSGAIAEPA